MSRKFADKELVSKLTSIQILFFAVKMIEMENFSNICSRAIEAITRAK